MKNITYVKRTTTPPKVKSPNVKKLISATIFEIKIMKEIISSGTFNINHINGKIKQIITIINSIMKKISKIGMQIKFTKIDKIENLFTHKDSSGNSPTWTGIITESDEDKNFGKPIFDKNLLSEP